MTLPPQSCEISSTNFWPKPNDPRGFGATITQPWAAHNAGFHRYDHASSHAPCGPPWSRKTIGYFLVGSKPDGRRTQYWIGTPPAPGTVRRSGLPNPPPPRAAWFSGVRGWSDFAANGSRNSSAGEVSVLFETTAKSRPACGAEIEPASDSFVISSGRPPSKGTRYSASAPFHVAVKKIVRPSRDSVKSVTDRSSASNTVR